MASSEGALMLSSRNFHVATRKKLLAAFLLLLIINVMLSAIVSVHAQNTEISVINPKTGDGNFIFYTDTTSNGTRFNATAWVYNVKDLFAYQVTLNVNDTLLNITRAWRPTWDPQWVFYGQGTVGTAPTLYDFDGDGSRERALVGDSLFFGGTKFTGNGTLAVIEFEIIHAPTLGKVSCNLDINNIDTFLFTAVDGSLIEIPATKTNGYYEYSLPPPTAAFSYSPSNPIVGQIVTFNASESKPSNITIPIINYTWNFGDGTPPITEDDPITNHTYTSAGRFNVTLMATDIGGLSGVTWQTIDVIVPGGSLITIYVNATVAMVGQCLNITGEIVPKKANVNVTILSRNGAVDWQTLAVVQTDDNSQYSYVWLLTQPGIFEIKSKWDGDAVTLGAESDIVSVRVLQYSTISIYVNPSNVTASSIVNINGTITPAPKEPANVTIQYRLNGTQKWENLSTLAENGFYSYNWTATKAVLGTQNDNDTFEFKTAWPGDNITLGSISQIEKVVVWKTELDITIEVTPQEVLTGSNATISGTITPARANLTINIGRSTNRNETDWRLWMPVGSNTTDVDGSYIYVWNIWKGLAGGLWLKSYYIGDNDTYPTNLSKVQPAFVNITKFSSNITISVNPSTLYVGSNVTINGTITQAKANVAVTIHYRRDGGAWGVLTTVDSDTYGDFNLTWEAGRFEEVISFEPKITVTRWKGGIYDLCASWEGDPLTYGAESGDVALTVLRNSSSLTIDVAPKNITLGSNVTITGTLTPAKANPTNLTIYYKNATGQWSLAIVPTDAEGHFNYTWTPEVAGNFEIYANWTGDDIYAPAESDIVTLKVEAPFTIFAYLPYIALGIVIVIVILLVYVFVKRKKKA